MKAASKTRLALSLTLLLFPLFTGAARAEQDLTDQLRAGGIVATSVPVTSGISPGRALALVDAPAQVVLEILAGFADYPSFVPRIIASRPVKEGRYVIESEFPWPVSKTWAYLQVRQGLKEGVHVLTWKMLNGSLKAYEGTAWIQPYGASRCLLTYQMLAVPHTIAPDALVSYGLREAVTGMVEAVRKQAAKVLAARARPGVTVAAEPAKTH
jgi:ribosome-associated toxin RatA of RatAB toxin-antitoxin module